MRTVRETQPRSCAPSADGRTCPQWFCGVRLENLSINYEVKGVTKGNAYACSTVETKS